MNLRYDKLLDIVDELFSHHDDEKLLSQFNQTAPWTTLQNTHTKESHMKDSD